MFTTIRAFRLRHRMLVLPVVLCASGAALHAQTGAAAANQNSTTPVTASAVGNYNLQIPAQLDLPAYSSSSASLTADASSTPAAPGDVVAANTSDHFNFLNAQYGRRRYGSPRYRGSNTNADGSEKYTFFAGVGFQQPLGNTYHYLTPSYSFQVGAGRNFSKRLGLDVQFDWDNFGFNGRTLALQEALYNQIITYYNNANPNNPTSPLAALDGHSHIWSVSLDPVYNVTAREDGLNFYTTAGVGFYHKVANFTTPEVGEYCDPYYGCYEYEANQSIDEYTSNALGVNAGFGLTYKFSHFSNERLYGEARYQYIFNQQRQGITDFTVTAANANVNNDYPANSNRSSYIPIKFGIRF